MVDNGSSDGTAGLLAHWERDEGDGRLVTGARVGLSRARNAARRLRRRGRAVPRRRRARPAHVGRALAAYSPSPDVGMAGRPDRRGVALGPAPRGWEPPRWTCGTAPSTLATRSGRSRATTGPTAPTCRCGGPRRSRSAGTTPTGAAGRQAAVLRGARLTRRLEAGGWAIRYEPEAAVVQQVLPERLEKRWLVRRGWAQGISNARLGVLGDQPHPAGAPPPGGRASARTREALAERDGGRTATTWPRSCGPRCTPRPRWSCRSSLAPRS